MALTNGKVKINGKKVGIQKLNELRCCSKMVQNEYYLHHHLYRETLIDIVCFYREIYRESKMMPTCHNYFVGANKMVSSCDDDCGEKNT